MVLFGCMCVELRWEKNIVAAPEILRPLETSQCAARTWKKGEVSDPRIPEDKEDARSSAMTYCTRVLKGRVEVPGKKEGTQAERNKQELRPLTAVLAHWHDSV